MPEPSASVPAPGVPPRDQSTASPEELLRACERYRREILNRCAAFGAGTAPRQIHWRAIANPVPGRLMASLWEKLTALGLGDVPPFLGEPRTAQDALDGLDAAMKWCQEKLARQPAADDKAHLGGPAGEDAALDAYLADHPDATEDEALDAINAALPPGAKPWSLDRLRKNPAWRAHVNRRIGERMDADPDATVEQIADAVGYSKSTVHGSAAYRQRSPARQQRRARQTEAKAKDRKRGRRDTLWLIVRKLVREYAEKNPGDLDPDLLRSYLLRCRQGVAWVREEWPQYVGSLSDAELTRPLTAPPGDGARG